MRPFAFATYARPDDTLVGAVVLDHTTAPTPVALADLDLPWADPHSVDSLFVDWDARFATVAGCVDALTQPPALDLTGLRIAPPVRPTQIWQAGANYRTHVADLLVVQRVGFSDDTPDDEVRVAVLAAMDERVRTGTPYIFTGMISAMCGADDDVVLPTHGTQPDWELELTAVTARRCWKTTTDQARSFIAGYTIANDLTLRDQVYRPDVPSIGTDWLRGKNAPTFLPVGPLFVPAVFAGDPTDLTLTLRLNGEVMQHESTTDMLFDVDQLLAYASSIGVLLPGDLLLTGSPAGNGAHYGRYLRPGDVMTAEITGLGMQHNRCVAAPA